MLRRHNRRAQGPSQLQYVVKPVLEVGQCRTLIVFQRIMPAVGPSVTGEAQYAHSKAYIK